MRYDFETVLKRRDTGSEKWIEMVREYPDIPDDIVPFSIADMEFDNAPEISEGLGKYINDNILGYTAPTDGYYDAVISWMKKRHGWDITREEIVDYPGIVPALFHFARELVKPGAGGGIIIMPPVYYPFKLAVENAGAALVECPLKNEGTRWEIDFELLETVASQPENVMLFLCSPHNPVGRVWTREELVRVGEICIKNDVLVVCDEIHNDLIMPGHEHICFGSISEEFAQNSIICTAPSKTFNLAGMQVSNVIIPNRDIRKHIKIRKFENGQLYCNALGYEACRIAYTECEEWLEELLKVIDGNRAYIEEFIAENIPEIKVHPLEGTYLQWFDCRGLGMDNEELEKFMKEKAFLFFDEGYIFGEGGNGFERMNIACPREVIVKAMERLRSAVDDLKK